MHRVTLKRQRRSISDTSQKHSSHGKWKRCALLLRNSVRRACFLMMVHQSSCRLVWRPPQAPKHHQLPKALLRYPYSAKRKRRRGFVNGRLRLSSWTLVRMKVVRRHGRDLRRSRSRCLKIRRHCGKSKSGGMLSMRYAIGNTPS